MNDIFKMAEQAYHALSIAESELKRLYKENAELKNSLNREWVGLTEQELDEAMKYWSDDSRSTYGGAIIADGEYVNMRDTWRYIEAKLKEKNCG